ncbi:MAG: hypothetical protein HY337_02340 [Gemmatimonadetes bacterium]|nr:hypothetical protein [Gemmatimonadota bacterium]
METQLALIADGANISVDGKVNILGEFDTLFAEAVPVRHPGFWFVAKLLLGGRDVGQKRLMLKLVDEDGNSVVPPLSLRLTIPLPGAEFTGDRWPLPVVLQVSSLLLPRFGAYVFELRTDDRVLAEVPLYVRPARGFGH